MLKAKLRVALVILSGWKQPFYINIDFSLLAPNKPLKLCPYCGNFCHKIQNCFKDWRSYLGEVGSAREWGWGFLAWESYWREFIKAVWLPHSPSHHCVKGTRAISAGLQIFPTAQVGRLGNQLSSYINLITLGLCFKVSPAVPQKLRDTVATFFRFSFWHHFYVQPKILGVAKKKNYCRNVTMQTYESLNQCNISYTQINNFADFSVRNAR